MKKAMVTAALGLGVMVSSMMGVQSVGAAPIGGAKAVSVEAVACPCEPMVTSTWLNMRSGPGTDYDVIMVLDKGAIVQVWTNAENRKNGFAKVRYIENYGWASLDYLTLVTADGEAYDTSGDEYAIVNSGYTNDSVNFRTGPGTNYGVIRYLDAGVQLAYSDMVINGFRYVWHAGQDGWVYDQYIDLFGEGGSDYYEPGTTLKTTSSLNLRAEPSTSSSVLTVMPSGAKVTAEGPKENGFVKVTYKGKIGWAYGDYLY